MKHGVVWHTGIVIACGAVGSVSARARGFCRAYSVLNQDGTLLQWQGGLVLEHFPFTNAASQCMWIWFADSPPALVGFLRALRFPPTPKNLNTFIFLVHSFWSLVVCIKPAAAVTQRCPDSPVGCREGRSRLPKFKFSANFSIGLHVILQLQIK